MVPRLHFFGQFWSGFWPMMVGALFRKVAIKPMDILSLGWAGLLTVLTFSIAMVIWGRNAM
jgi:cytochrome b6-f complex subunit 8